jgi:hypothetical protein
MIKHVATRDVFIYEQVQQKRKLISKKLKMVRLRALRKIQYWLYYTFQIKKMIVSSTYLNFTHSSLVFEEMIHSLLVRVSAWLQQRVKKNVWIGKTKHATVSDIFMSCTRMVGYTIIIAGDLRKIYEIHILTKKTKINMHAIFLEHVHPKSDSDWFWKWPVCRFMLQRSKRPSYLFCISNVSLLRLFCFHINLFTDILTRV